MYGSGHEKILRLRFHNRSRAVTRDAFNGLFPSPRQRPNQRGTNVLPLRRQLSAWPLGPEHGRKRAVAATLAYFLTNDIGDRPWNRN